MMPNIVSLIVSENRMAHVNCTMQNEMRTKHINIDGNWELCLRILCLFSNIREDVVGKIV